MSEKGKGPSKVAQIAALRVAQAEARDKARAEEARLKKKSRK